MDDLCGVSSSSQSIKGSEGDEDAPRTPRRGWIEPVRCGTTAAPPQSRPSVCSGFPNLLKTSSRPFFFLWGFLHIAPHAQHDMRGDMQKTPSSKHPCTTYHQKQP